MVFDLSLLNSLQPVLYALSDRINRLSRFFEAIMTQTGPHNLEECVGFHWLVAYCSNVAAGTSQPVITRSSAPWITLAASFSRASPI
jgi:hypothetical protein